MKIWKFIIGIFFIFALNIPFMVLAQDTGTKTCANKAFNLLKQKDKIGYDIVNKVNDMNFFTTWLFCENPPLYNLTAAVHETNHQLSFKLSDYTNGFYGYYLGNEQTLTVKMKNLFYRSKISEYLDAFDKGQNYYELYLTGDSGNQDITVLLDEVNAYTHSLNSSICFVDLISKYTMQSDRDGLATFMYYFELYLKKARISYPDQWKQMYNDPEYLDLFAALWKRAESVLKTGLKHSQLGIQDKFIIKRVYDKKNIDELVQVFAKGGQTFTYDTNILKTANNLKQTLIPSGNNPVNTNQKTITTQTTTKTITINGQPMTMEQFKEYLKEHPELKSLPQIQELLKP